MSKSTTRVAANRINDRDLLIQVHTLLEVVRGNVDKMTTEINNISQSKADRSELTRIENAVQAKVEEVKKDTSESLSEIKKDIKEVRVKLEEQNAWMNKANGVALVFGSISALITSLILKFLIK